jgi:sulfur-oxidizing protein SoxX
LLCGTGACAALSLAAAQDTPLGFQIIADGIPQPLAATPGDTERGHALLVERGAANCLLCHAIPDPKIRVSGNVGPSLAGIGAKLSAAQIRLRIADIQRVSPDAAMPSYYRVAGLDRVAGEYRGKPVLDAAQIEDLVAYLQTLK